MADFNADQYNKACTDPRGFGNSGLSAGVESGLSSVERLNRSSLEMNNKSKGSDFRHAAFEESAGSKGGKSFIHKG
jgi:hypothetical protein